MKTSWLAFVLLCAPCFGAKLSVYPPRIKLFGSDATQVIAVSFESGRIERDVTSLAETKTADSKVAAVAGGVIKAAANGNTVLQVSYGGLSAEVPISVAQSGQKPKLSFVNDVVPIFTMAGCAGANCHGSIRGQRGFKLSLFGYEPKLDYEALTAGDSKRINQAEPGKSAILQKPTTEVPHGGGFRFAVGSLEYNTLRQWIIDGTPYDTQGTPRLIALKVFPEERVLVGANSTQQLIATADYSDGTTRDVTHLVQYTSNNPDVVQSSAGGVVKALQAGETAIMVRTLGKAVAARILVAESATALDYPESPRNNYIDEHVFSKLKRLNIRPSPLSSDGHYLRRVSLDTIGLLPTESEAVAFLDSKDPAKRSKVIDQLLERPEFSELFRAGTREAGPKGGKIVYEYVKRSFLEKKPYDRFVTELLLSQGSHLFGTEPTSFYNISFDSNPGDHATNISQIFLGTRLECARCHNHPWEKWTQDDFYGFAAFFGRVGIKEVYENDENATLYKEEGAVIHPKTKEAVSPKYLDGGAEQDEPDRDIREALARWMTAPGNPLFSRAIVNRVWKHYMGRGLVEEVDDFRVTNPPTNPALLDAMARDFAKSGYDFRHLIRTILNSRAYQLSAEPNESNRNDTVNYSRYMIRRLQSEQMLDTIWQVTGVQERFNGYPPGTRAMQVYAGSPGYMLAAFGRLNRDIICERDQQPDMAQTLHLISGDTIQRKITSPEATINKMLKDPALNDGRIVESIFLTSLTRRPDAAERAQVLARLQAAPDAAGRKKVYEDLLWAILNSKEFLYNH